MKLLPLPYLCLFTTPVSVTLNWDELQSTLLALNNIIMTWHPVFQMFWASDNQWEVHGNVVIDALQFWQAKHFFFVSRLTSLFLFVTYQFRCCKMILLLVICIYYARYIFVTLFSILFQNHLLITSPCFLSFFTPVTVSFSFPIHRLILFVIYSSK